jgi:16S rRNA (guanine527-N7)-methyltransferase
MTNGRRTTTAPPPPGGGAVVALFGARVSLVERYAEHLATSAVERGLIGPREVPRLWDRHLLNCAAVTELIAPGVRCVDVGSGAGLPGVVIAIARPDVEVSLVEPLLRRVTWLEEVVDDLGLANVKVIRARAEELHRGGAIYEVALARAVAPLDRLAGWCLPLVLPGGRLLALKGRSAHAEVEASSVTLTSLGAQGWSVVECGGDVLAEPTRVVVVTAGAVTALRGTARSARSGRVPGAGHASGGASSGAAGVPTRGGGRRAPGGSRRGAPGTDRRRAGGESPRSDDESRDR